MISTQIERAVCVLLFSAMLSACATTGSIVQSPAVELAGVELTSANFKHQTFLLHFNVANPNPFSLPVRVVKYQVRLDQEKFAAGETEGSFSVPAGGRESFAISVELDVLRSATQLASLLRGGLRENVAYELNGHLAVDIPFVKPLPFSQSGVINLSQTAADQFD